MASQGFIRELDLKGVTNSPICRKLFDHLSVGIAIVSTDGIIRYGNAAYLQMLGLDESEFVGKHSSEVFPTAETGVLAAMRDRVINKTSSICSNGIEAITNRYPIIDKEGVLLGAITETIASNINKKRMSELSETLRSLEQRANYYERKVIGQSHCMHTFDSILGESPALREVKGKGRLFARSSEPVLICGESGTGKELFAQALHTASPRAQKQFVSVNCAALPNELMESELFGYGEGAFTGSRSKGMKGKFELADHGTIFLDEIAELPKVMQAKLLRVLENGEIQKLSHAAPLYVDFRLVAATNKDLVRLVSEGSFREDLYHRLSVLQLDIPPLTKRLEDIPCLIAHFIERAAGAERAQRLSITPRLLDLFNRYPWPGNLRELRNLITFALCLLENDATCIDTRHLPERFLDNFHARPEAVALSPGTTVPTFTEASVQSERRLIRDALARAGQNRSRAARELKISRSKLYRKMHDLGLLPDQ